MHHNVGFPCSSAGSDHAGRDRSSAALPYFATDDLTTWAIADSAFHRILVELAGNKLSCQAPQPSLWRAASTVDVSHERRRGHFVARPASIRERLWPARERLRRCADRTKYIARPSKPPSQSWKTFLQNHAEAIAAIDMCVVPTLTFDLLFAFLVLGHGRRQVMWLEVTRHPTAEWLARQITEAFPWTSVPAYLVCDNDRAYGHVFTSRMRAMGIRDRPISPQSPWQNGYAERLIGTLRRECLDQVVIFGETHLRRILSAYAAYYNQARTHLALEKDAPLHRAVQRSGSIVAIPILAGLHHQYIRI
jgi:transposase InsO family protein